LPTARFSDERQLACSEQVNTEKPILSMTDPTPIFYDDFNSGLDPSKWQTITANNWYVSNPNLLSWDANEFVPSNVSLSDGVLNLYADTGPNGQCVSVEPTAVVDDAAASTAASASTSGTPNGRSSPRHLL
jgi:hypothetical protein